jgi:hypothetical protein
MYATVWDSCITHCSWAVLKSIRGLGMQQKRYCIMFIHFATVQMYVHNVHTHINT